MRAERDREIAQALADEWRDRCARHPVRASQEGDRSHDDRWDDSSLEAAQEEAEHKRETIARLSALKADGAGEFATLNCEIAMGELADDVEGHRLGTHLFAISILQGIHLAMRLARQLPFRTERDYENWIARLETYDVAIRQTIETLRFAVKQRFLWPKVAAERMIRVLDRTLADPEASEFFKPFEKSPKPALRDRARDAIAAHVNAGIAELRAFLVEEYLPAAPAEIGLTHVPGGDELYRYWVRFHTGTDLTPEQIHELGLSEVERIRSRLESVTRRIEGDPVTYAPSSDALFNLYCVAAKQIVEPGLVKLFSFLPRLPYGITAMEPAVAPEMPAAYYSPGALDGTRAGMFYVNLYKSDARPLFEVLPLTLH